jgi:UPF0755 protein
MTDMTGPPTPPQGEFPVAPVPLHDAARDTGGPSDLGDPVDPGDPGERVPRHARRSRRTYLRRRLVVSIVGAVVVVVLAAVLWYELESSALGPAGRQEIVSVKTGESVNSVAATLAHTHVIGSTLAFRISDLVHGTPSIEPGLYELHQNLTFAQVRNILSGGPNIFAVNVQRGLTLNEVAQQVDQLPGHGHASFARVASSGAVHSTFSAPGSNDLEGLLGTGTYLVLPGETDTTILTDMVHRFDAQATAAGLSTASAAALNLTPYQVITAASIVEKEGYIYKNMPDVARVIYNRLAAGMPLQMNSTVLYSLGQDGGVVTSKDLQLQTPYNTYLNTGLTPTPICSPSPTALAAAVHPPQGAWIYFVLVRKDGTEAFADTYAEQLANEKLAQARGVG